MKFFDINSQKVVSFYPERDEIDIKEVDIVLVEDWYNLPYTKLYESIYTQLTKQCANIKPIPTMFKFRVISAFEELNFEEDDKDGLFSSITSIITQMLLLNEPRGEYRLNAKNNDINLTHMNVMRLVNNKTLTDIFNLVVNFGDEIWFMV